MESMVQMNVSVKQKQTHRPREGSCGRQGEGGGGMDWEFGVSRCKLFYVAWIYNKDLFYIAYHAPLSMEFSRHEYWRE